MINSYYRGALSIFFVSYWVIYFSATGLGVKKIYVNRLVRIFLGKSHEENSIPLIIVICHILNIANLIIAVLGYQLINIRTAHAIYRYTILFSLFVIFIINVFIDKEK